MLDVPGGESVEDVMVFVHPDPLQLQDGSKLFQPSFDTILTLQTLFNTVSSYCSPFSNIELQKRMLKKISLANC
jgi:hypothetical protein